jgi:Pterin-4a-carbinolamine dehydratase
MVIEKPQVKLDHFADIGFFYNEVILMVYTHDVGGLTQLDFELALYIDEALRKMDARQLEEEKKGLYYYVNKRKKAGTNRKKGHPKAPSDQDWKAAARTAKKENVEEKWSEKYKKSINCNNPKGFSQKAHCSGRKKK